MTIATRKITAFLKTISALADAPALGSSALLKAWFDSSPEELRLEINGVIDDLLAIAPGASGADNIGSAPITGVTGATTWAQLSSLATLLYSTSNNMNQQAIINAAVEVWQQGTAFTNPAIGAYTADMWLQQRSISGTLPTTIIHSQVSLTPGELFNSKYAYNINVNGAGSGFATNDNYGMQQRIEFGTSKLCGNGKKVTISFYAKSSIVGKRIAASMIQSYGTGGAASINEVCVPTATTIRTLTSSMALYTFTFTTNTLTGKTFGTNNDDSLRVEIEEMWGAGYATQFLGGGTAETFVGSGNITFTEVVVNAGDVALPFQPKSKGQEEFDCFYYYQRNFSQKSVGTFWATTSANITLNFHRPMRIAPTVTKIGTTVNMDDVGSGGLSSTGALSGVTTTTTAAKLDIIGFTGANTFRFAKLADDSIQADARL